MKRIIFLLTALVFSIGALSAQQKKAVISIHPVFPRQKPDILRFDYQNLAADGKVSHTFKIDNTGDAPLVLTRVIASCGCTTPEWTKEPIAPGKSGDVKITYNPAGRPGVFAKAISIYSNGKKGSYILTIKGKVK